MKFIEDLTERAKEAKRLKEEERKEILVRAAEKHSQLKLKDKLETKNIYVEKAPTKLLDSQRVITTPEPTDEKITVIKADRNLNRTLAELPNHEINVKTKTDDADEWNKKPRFSMPKRTEKSNENFHISLVTKLRKSPYIRPAHFFQKS